MGGKYEPMKGDRVRVVLEGEVSSLGLYGFYLKGGLYGTYYIHVNDNEHAVSVEKVEPPVEIFGPGDTVRSKYRLGSLYSIGKGGYFDHHRGCWVSSETTFTSEHYERVDLS